MKTNENQRRTWDGVGPDALSHEQDLRTEVAGLVAELDVEASPGALREPAARRVVLGDMIIEEAHASDEGKLTRCAALGWRSK